MGQLRAESHIDVQQGSFAQQLGSSRESCDVSGASKFLALYRIVPSCPASGRQEVDCRLPSCPTAVLSALRGRASILLGLSIG